MERYVQESLLGSHMHLSATGGSRTGGTATLSVVAGAAAVSAVATVTAADVGRATEAAAVVAQNVPQHLTESAAYLISVYNDLHSLAPNVEADYHHLVELMRMIAPLVVNFAHYGQQIALHVFR